MNNNQILNSYQNNPDGDFFAENDFVSHKRLSRARRAQRKANREQV